MFFSKLRRAHTKICAEAADISLLVIYNPLT